MVDGMESQGHETPRDRESIEETTLAERSKVTAPFLASWPGGIAALVKVPSVFLTGESIDLE